MVIRGYYVPLIYKIIEVIRYAMLIGRPPFETSEVKKTYERIKKNAYSFPDYIPISD